MYPFIHIGHFSIGTFGLCLWLASVCACWVLYCNFRRFGIDADAVGVAAYTTVGGVLGAKLWHVLEDPATLIHQPVQVLFDRAGFAWFGGLLVGIAVLVWAGRQARIGGLGMLDLAAPAVSVGYGVGRIGCLVSGDGDYGIPTSLPWGMSFPHGLVPTIQRVHPTPIYEFLVALLIAALSMAPRGEIPRRPHSAARTDYRRIFSAQRGGSLPGGVHPHQSAHLLGHEQCSSRQPGFHRRRHFAYRMGTAPQRHRDRRRGYAGRSRIPALAGRVKSERRTRHIRRRLRSALYGLERW